MHYQPCGVGQPGDGASLELEEHSQEGEEELQGTVSLLNVREGVSEGALKPQDEGGGGHCPATLGEHHRGGAEWGEAVEQSRGQGGGRADEGPGRWRGDGEEGGGDGGEAEAGTETEVELARCGGEGGGEAHHLLGQTEEEHVEEGGETLADDRAPEVNVPEVKRCLSHIGNHC